MKPSHLPCLQLLLKCQNILQRMFCYRKCGFLLMKNWFLSVSVNTFFWEIFPFFKECFPWYFRPPQFGKKEKLRGLLRIGTSFCKSCVMENQGGAPGLWAESWAGVGAGDELCTILSHWLWSFSLGHFKRAAVTSKCTVLYQGRSKIFCSVSPAGFETQRSQTSRWCIFDYYCYRQICQLL